MVNIDYIFELLDWNSSIEDKQKGLSLARKVKCITVFLQPGYPYGKNVWENCAIILAEKSDTELERFLSPLMTWLQDLNWPGSDIILSKDRICYISERKKKQRSENLRFDHRKHEIHTLVFPKPIPHCPLAHRRLRHAERGSFSRQNRCRTLMTVIKSGESVV